MSEGIARLPAKITGDAKRLASGARGVFQKETYENIGKLTVACHSVFFVQSVIGAIGCVVNFYSHSEVSFSNVSGFVVPLFGFANTRDAEHANWRALRWPALFWLGEAIYSLIDVLFDFPSLRILPAMLKLCITSVQWYAIANLWRMQRAAAIQEFNGFYLNVQILNKEEVIREKVAGKIHNPFLGSIASKMANHVVSGENFAAKVADAIAEKVPDIMAQTGITATAKIEWRYENFFVIRISILNVDMPALVASKKGAEAGKLERILTMVPVAKQQIGAVLAILIAGKMIDILPEKIGNQLREQAGLDVDVECKGPSEEAEFLFRTMDRLRGQEGGGREQRRGDEDRADEEAAVPALGGLAGLRQAWGSEKEAPQRSMGGIQTGGLPAEGVGSAASREHGGWQPGKVLKTGASALRDRMGGGRDGPADAGGLRAPLLAHTSSGADAGLEEGAGGGDVLDGVAAVYASTTAVGSTPQAPSATQAPQASVSKTAVLDVVPALVQGSAVSAEREGFDGEEAGGEEGPKETSGSWRPGQLISRGVQKVAGKIEAHRESRRERPETPPGNTEDGVDSNLSGMHVGEAGHNDVDNEGGVPVTQAASEATTATVATAATAGADEGPVETRKSYRPSRLISRGVNKVASKIEAHREARRERHETRARDQGVADDGGSGDELLDVDGSSSAVALTASSPTAATAAGDAGSPPPCAGDAGEERAVATSAGPASLEAAATEARKATDGIPMSTVARHATRKDCWIVVNRRVLDVTAYLPQHPGGELTLLSFAGKDCSLEFEAIHPADYIDKHAPGTVIGTVVTDAEDA